MPVQHAQRYVRNFSTLTVQDQDRLHSSRICLLGLGGLGGVLLEMLARMGIGRKGAGWIRAADGDLFEASNLNRQLLCMESNIGKSKAVEATTRITAVNSEIDLTTCHTFISSEAMPEFIRGADIVLDALGDLPSKLSLHRAAQEVGLPVITAAVAGWTGFITTLLPGDTAEIFRGVLSQEEGAEITLGTLVPAVWLIAALQCREAVALTCGHASLFHGRLHIVDLTDATWETILLRSDRV
jgi:molybdopterin/thiamine biosynthesis adenylyltransferase